MTLNSLVFHRHSNRTSGRLSHYLRIDDSRDRRHAGSGNGGKRIKSSGQQKGRPKGRPSKLSNHDPVRTHDTTHYRASTTPEAKTLATTIMDRGLEQLDTGPPPFCC